MLKSEKKSTKSKETKSKETKNRNQQNNNISLKDSLLNEILKIISKESLDKYTIEKACQNLKIDTGVAALLFPKGNIEIIEYFFTKINNTIKNKIQKITTFDKLSIREKVIHCIKLRLEALNTTRIASTNIINYLMQPLYLHKGLKLAWIEADNIWTTIQDTSVDYNYYTKRSALCGIYIKILIKFSNNTSEDIQEVIEYSNNKINSYVENIKYLKNIKNKYF